MKNFLLILTFLLVSTGLFAQQYAVYRVMGEASLVVKKAKTPLEKGMKLEAKDILNLSEGCELKLFDEEAREMITLKDQCAGSVESLIAAQTQSRQSMTAEYFAYIVRNMQGLGQEERVRAGRTTGIFRDDADSLLSIPDSIRRCCPCCNQCCKE